MPAGSATRAELNAGTVLTTPGGSTGMTAYSGFSSENTPADNSDMSSAQDTTIPGTFGAAAPTLTFKDRDDAGGHPVRVALPEGTSGFVVRMPYGDVPGRRMLQFPVRVAGVNDGEETRNDVAKFTIQFAQSAAANKNATIPA